jgi:hypothetical protein
MTGAVGRADGTAARGGTVTTRAGPDGTVTTRAGPDGTTTTRDLADPGKGKSEQSILTDAGARHVGGSHP